MRTDLAVTTAGHETADLLRRADALGAELSCERVDRRRGSLAAVFAAHPDCRRLLVVETERLVLRNRDGAEIFFHPNMGYLRITNLQRGDRDMLLAAARLEPGDAVLDATLGFGGEAVLCAHAVGETGRVDGIEAVPELGVVVRDGLRTLNTASGTVNAAMRRVRVVALTPHGEFLRTCPDRAYDVVCFDPFFDTDIDPRGNLGRLRTFGAHVPLSASTVADACRVARKRVVVKAARPSGLLDTLGITEVYGRRAGRTVYGVIETG